ncbi:MAG TPA: translocation/assembly module TamB domain-containing protein [Polyangia bacterium]|nr:translocation/assembly module TamB domain-containing protein [Polyangia bacterium]
MARRALAVVVAVVALAALLVGGALVLLQTPWGGRVVLGLVLPRVNARIGGRVEVTRLRVQGASIRLDGLELRDPAGELVASVGALELDVSPRALLRRELRVSRRVIERPRLLLREDARGSNLARALAPRGTRSARAPGREPRWRLDVDALRVSSGVVDEQSAIPRPGPRHFRAADVAGHGAGWFDLGTGRLDARLRLDGRVEAPLRAPFTLEGSVTGGPNDDRGHVEVELGDATLRGRAEVTPHAVRLEVDRLHVPGALAAAAWPALGLDADVEGEATLSGPRGNLAAATGRARLSVGRGRLGGAGFGPAHLDVTADDGTLRVRALEAALPGAYVSARGTISRRRLELRADLRAGDLAAAAHSLRPLAPGAPPLAGHGRLRADLSGTPDAPAVRATARFPSLRVGASSVSGLSLAAEWPDARRPLVGEVKLRAERAALAGRALRAVSMDLATRGASFRLAADVRGAAPLAVSASGAWTADRRGLELSSLQIATREIRWTQQARPLLLEVEPGRLRVRGLDLRAGAQRIRADLERRDGRARVSLDVAGFDARLVPKLLLPAGAPELPTTRLDLDARLDVPTHWPAQGRAPLWAHVDLKLTHPGDVAAGLGASQARDGGPLTARLDLDGTASAPHLDARASVAGVLVDGESLGDVALAVSSGPAGSAVASLSLAKGTARGALEIATPLPLPRLARLASSGSGWANAPFEAKGELAGLPLGVLSRLARRPPWRGALDLRVAARGTPAAPEGALHVDVRGAASGRIPPTDLRVDASIDSRDVRVAARVWRTRAAARAPQGPPLAWLSAIVAAPAARLRDLEALERAPLDVRLGVGPATLVRRDDGVAAASDEGAPKEAAASLLRARVLVEAFVRGTLRQPTADVVMRASSVTVGGAPMGEAHAELSYARRRISLAASATSSGGGTLRLTAHASADLGYPAVANAFAPARVPVDADLEADRFDLGWLSGVSRPIRRVAGVLTASVRGRGTAVAPAVAGRLEVAHGALTIAGLGDYHDVHLRAHAEDDRIALDELSAESLGGHARLSGRLERERGRAALHLASRLDRFPLYGQAGLLGRLSLDASADGTLAAATLDETVKVREAHVELETLRQRKLAPLSRPTDVAVVDHGAPIDAESARALRAWRGAPLPGTAAGAPPGAFAVKLAIDAPRDLWVRGNDANVEVGLDPGFHVVLGAETRVYGSVVVRRGRVDVLGRRFDLQAGSSAELTGPPGEPVLDATAKYVNDALNVTVVVTVKGPLAHLSIGVNAPDHPELTETQLYTLIVTGRLDLSGAGGPTASTSTATSLLGGVLAGQLQRLAGNRLPLDVFSFETSDGLTGSRLEAGTNVGSKLYVGYVGRAGANPALLQNRNAVRIEYQLTSRWSLDAEYGDVGTGTADLFWTKRY